MPEGDHRDRRVETLRLHHVGIGTERFDEAIELYEALDHTLLRRVDDEGLGVRIAFLDHSGDGPLIEIVAPLGPEGPLSSLIRRRVLPSPYHTGYAVQKLEQGDRQLTAVGFLPLGEPRCARALEGARIRFYLHRAVGLVELIENPPRLVAP